MKKSVKVYLSFLIALAILLAALAATWAFWLAPLYANTQASDTDTQSYEKHLKNIAEASDEIDYSEDESLLYSNCTILLTSTIDTPIEKIEALAKDYAAKLDDSLASMAAYKLTFDNSMTLDELDQIAKEIGEHDFITNACAEVFFLSESQTVSVDLPNDPWSSRKNSSVTWDMDNPDGNNWGLEAIRAPAAWAYKDQMQLVKVGIIDTQPDLNHEDLNVTSSKLYFNSGGVETEDNYPAPEGPDSGHGTHVGGIMCATWNNNIGLSGVICGENELHHAKYYYDIYGTWVSLWTPDSLLKNIDYLLANGVQVINLSEGFDTVDVFNYTKNGTNWRIDTQVTQLSNGLYNIIVNEDKKDFIIVTSAGNSNGYALPLNKNGEYESITLGNILKKREDIDTQAEYNSLFNLIKNEIVKSRIITVGAIEIDEEISTNQETFYKLTNFSNIGARVDILAPGVDIFSTYPDGYAQLPGTSQAAPMVAGVAGLIYACNPSLTGSQVKSILLNSTLDGHQIDAGGPSKIGIIDAEKAVIAALKSLEEPLDDTVKYPGEYSYSALDLCFIVDTTGSMDDNIDNTKKNMEKILKTLKQKTENYRIALIDYRDFADRTGDNEDYPSKIQLNFTNDDDAIINAINRLTLGNGGDTEETVYSALMKATTLDWREFSTKTIIVLGDAGPLDPEPNTGYTYEDVLRALTVSKIAVDKNESDSLALGKLTNDTISVFPISVNADSYAIDFFETIAADTYGSFADVDDADDVADAVVESIEQIEIVTSTPVTMNFGAEYANQTIYLYRDGEYQYYFTLDNRGQKRLPEVEFGSYSWKCIDLCQYGHIDIEADTKAIKPTGAANYWFTPVQTTWISSKNSIMLCAAGAVLVITAIPVVISAVTSLRKKQK